jgi:hypothetical protein
MKYSRLIILGLVILLAPQIVSAQTSRANRAWKPFFASVRAAVQKRDKNALMKMMSRDFYYLSSGGDENDNQDTRDEAFDYWASAQAGSWEALDKALAAGAVVNTAMREPDNTNPSRVAPPLANDKTAISNRSFEWYAVFEFRNNRWYFTAFTECCE